MRYFSKNKGLFAGLLILMACSVKSPEDEHTQTADVIVYGGTSGAVSTAIQLSRMGRSVIVVSPDQHLGGLTSSGLGWTDTGDKSVIGGIAREFYHRVYRYYEQPETWKWQEKEEYGNKGQGTPAIDGENKTMWIFEPHIAEQVFEDLVRDHQVTVVRDEWLDRENGVVMEGQQIISIKTLAGNTYRGKIFIDATYEGDLMASAGLSYHVGREPNDMYHEKWNGVQAGIFHHGHHFGNMNISPYVIPGDPESGLLPGISAEEPWPNGEGDCKLQAYCFRLCLTKHPENRIPFEKPVGYDSGQYALLLRVFDAGWRETFHKFDPIPNVKTDVNNHGPFSSDNIGMNYDYPEASYERRKEIIKEHEVYQKGLFYFIANDPRVPADVREEMKQWGLSSDEFKDNGHWPHQIYVREARRMIGEYIMTENEILGEIPVDKSIGMGSYTMDSHNVQRYVTPEGYVQNEGDIGVHPEDPYRIHAGTIIPLRDECTNLLVPVAVSSSHIAFGSIRMEPVFMILGQSAGTLAGLALEQGIGIHEVDYDVLKSKLLADGQVLSVN